MNLRQKKDWRYRQAEKVLLLEKVLESLDTVVAEICRGQVNIRLVKAELSKAAYLVDGLHEREDRLLIAAVASRTKETGKVRLVRAVA